MKKDLIKLTYDDVEDIYLLGVRDDCLEDEEENQELIEFIEATMDLIIKKLEEVKDDRV